MTIRPKAQAILDQIWRGEMPETMPIEFLPIAFRAYRETSKIGLREAARQSGISSPALCRFEAEDRAGLYVVKAAARWIGVKTITIDATV